MLKLAENQEEIQYQHTCGYLRLALSAWTLGHGSRAGEFSNSAEVNVLVILILIPQSPK